MAYTHGSLDKIGEAGRQKSLFWHSWIARRLMFRQYTVFIPFLHGHLLFGKSGSINLVNDCNHRDLSDSRPPAQQLRGSHTSHTPSLPAVELPGPQDRSHGRVSTTDSPPRRPALCSPRALTLKKTCQESPLFFRRTTCRVSLSWHFSEVLPQIIQTHSRLRGDTEKSGRITIGCARMPWEYALSSDLENE